MKSVVCKKRENILSSGGVVTVCMVCFGLGWVLLFFFMSEIDTKQVESFHFSHGVVDGITKVRLLNANGHAASYGEALALMESSDSFFRDMLTDVLSAQQQEVPAYFWECPPFSVDTLGDVPFEFVIIPANVLLTRSPDKFSFREKFAAGEPGGAVTFPSLGGDALLVAPVPKRGVDDDVYMHLATFVSHANKEQVDRLWLTVAHTIRQLMSTTSDKIWLSTSGAGVQWLHVRLDSRPKYYNWREYIEY